MPASVTNVLPPGPNKKPNATRRRFARGTAPAVKSAERKRRNREAASDLRKRKVLYELSLEKTADGLDADVAALRRREAELATRIAWYEHRLGPAAAAMTTSEGVDEVMAIGSPASTCGSSGYDTMSDTTSDSMSDSMSDSEPAADRDNVVRCPLSPNHDDDRPHETESRHPRRTNQQDTPGFTPETEPSTPSLNDPPTPVGQQQQQHTPRIVHRYADSSRHSPALRPTDGAAARMGGTPSLGALTKPAVFRSFSQQSSSSVPSRISPATSLGTALIAMLIQLTRTSTYTCHTAKPDGPSSRNTAQTPARARTSTTTSPSAAASTKTAATAYTAFPSTTTPSPPPPFFPSATSSTLQMTTAGLSTACKAPPARRLRIRVKGYG